MGFTELNLNTREVTDTICGTAVWHLGGVNIDNKDAIMRTNAWIHYSELGDNGWWLACSQVQAVSWQKHFRRSGITIETRPELPYKPFGLWIIVPAFIVIACSFIAGTKLPFLLIPAFIIAIFWNQQRCRNIHFAAGLKGLMQYTTIRDNYVYQSVVGKE